MPRVERARGKFNRVMLRDDEFRRSQEARLSSLFGAWTLPTATSGPGEDR